MGGFALPEGVDLRETLASAADTPGVLGASVPLEVPAITRGTAGATSRHDPGARHLDRCDRESVADEPEEESRAPALEQGGLYLPVGESRMPNKSPFVEDGSWGRDVPQPRTRSPSSPSASRASGQSQALDGSSADCTRGLAESALRRLLANPCVAKLAVTTDSAAAGAKSPHQSGTFERGRVAAVSQEAREAREALQAWKSSCVIWRSIPKR